MPRQLVLPLPTARHYADWPFIEAESNRDAVALLDAVARWPDHRLALVGAAGSGKTHLLHRWADRRRGMLVLGAALRFPAPGRSLALDDADLAGEEDLLHVLNDAAERGVPVLLAARASPARWPVRLPDLASRLRGMLCAELGRPDEALLRALLARLFAERQMSVAPALQDWLRLRLPREAAAMREVAARLDRASLGHGPPSRALAGAVVDEMRGMWQPVSS